MRALLAVLLTSAVLLGACGDDDDGDADGDTLVVTDRDTGSEIEVGTGERFTLRLESNPSTGYAWELDEVSMPTVVELVSTEFEESSDDDLVGAPGTEVYVFEATATGAGILRLEYLRSFDDPPIPERIVEYILRVDGAPWPPDTSDVDPPTTDTATADP